MATSYLFAIIIVFNLRLTGASVNVTKVHDSAEALDNEGTVLAEHSTLTYKYSKLYIHVLSIIQFPAPNRGMNLWFQQFWAMFLKRVYNSLRFWGALVSQLLLPVGFVLFALVLAVSGPAQNQDDPKRSLDLKNSAESPDNISLFYAQFGESSPLNFSVCHDAHLCFYFNYNYTELFLGY